MIEELTSPGEVVTADEAATLLRLDTTDYDALLAGNLLAARELLERDTARVFGPRGYRLTLDCFSHEITIPRAPVSAVTEIRYTDTDGNEVVLDASTYVVRERNGLKRIRLATGANWPALGTDGQVKIEFTAGENPISEVARMAIVQLAGYWFDNPAGSVSEGYQAAVNRLKMIWL